MPEAFVAAPILLAAVLILAAVAKWRERPSLVSSMRLLRLPAWLHPTARFLPEMEVALAIGLLVLPWWQAFIVAAALTLGLMLAYTGIISRGLTMTPRPTCGCFGTVGSPIKGETLVRNITLSVLALLGLLWGITGHTVPSTLLSGGVGIWGWVLMLVATAAITRWIVGEHSRQLPPRFVPAHESGLVMAHEPVHPVPVEEVDEADYIREPIPALMLFDGEKPVTLTRLATDRAVLLIWVTCGCGRSHDGLAKAQEWQEAMPLIDVRMVSTLSPEDTVAFFPSQAEWLYDVEGQAMRALDIHFDPAVLLLGADGLLAGGPVSGLAEVIDFGEQIRDQLTEAVIPEAAEAPAAPSELLGPTEESTRTGESREDSRPNHPN